MKITVDIDCTPAEARELMGLPDVRPLQAGIMSELEARMRAGLDQMSPQAVLQNWLAMSPTGVPEQFMRMFDLAGTTKKPK